jgi:hypothetical protein
MSPVRCDLYNETMSRRSLATSRTYIDSFVTHRIFLLGAMISLYPLVCEEGLCGYKVLTAVFVQL